MKDIDKSIEFYEALANLFYAVSMSDGQITREEKLKIIEFVKKYWTVTIDNENSQEFIYQTLKELIKNKSKPESAFLVFKDFYLNNKKGFHQDLLTRILIASNAIASSFGKKNKSELIVLNNLMLLFKS
ncbi:hypothetical protein Q4Q39_20425 [Flavivirga amylovorans]|uniref:TerB family tellurite resistance protein n=1 Tax=Flavivirga amylovorans TaxID=870486 RepID=A0ABT8X713_9FLAO|nr:hypothetical protein [Flavivirga amylovorans]MDO5989776.1 hypothetical protein [Flavivirga amylovorans]